MPTPTPIHPSRSRRPRAPTPEMWTRYLAGIAARAGEKRVTLTPIRHEVLKLLFQHPQGLKAYDLLSKVKLQRDNATPPTVYRALDFLIEQGLVHKIGRSSMFVACRHTSHQLPSLFLACPSCHAVAELQNAELMQTLIATLNQAGYCLNSPEVELSALCPACGKEKEEA